MYAMGLVCYDFGPRIARSQILNLIQPSFLEKHLDVVSIKVNLLTICGATFSIRFGRVLTVIGLILRLDPPMAISKDPLLCHLY